VYLTAQPLSCSAGTGARTGRGSWQKRTDGAGPHPEAALTKPGDVLEVEILDIQLRQRLGHNVIWLLAGNKTRMVGRTPWGLELSLAPSFGLMGVVPRAAWGRNTLLIPRCDGRQSRQQRADAGRRILLAGVRAGRPVFLRRWPSCAWATARFALPPPRPRCRDASKDIAEGFGIRLSASGNPTHHMTMAMDTTLDQCVVKALRDTVMLLREKRNLSREDAYTGVQPGGRPAGDNGHRIEGNPPRDREHNCSRMNTRASTRPRFKPLASVPRPRTVMRTGPRIQEMRRGWKDAWPPSFARTSPAIPV
jgi:hypothetical protein